MCFGMVEHGVWSVMVVKYQASQRTRSYDLTRKTREAGQELAEEAQQEQAKKSRHGNRVFLEQHNATHNNLGREEPSTKGHTRFVRLFRDWSQRPAALVSAFHPVLPGVSTHPSFRRDVDSLSDRLCSPLSSPCYSTRSFFCRSEHTVRSASTGVLDGLLLWFFPLFHQRWSFFGGIGSPGQHSV